MKMLKLKFFVSLIQFNIRHSCSGCYKIIKMKIFFPPILFWQPAVLWCGWMWSCDWQGPSPCLNTSIEFELLFSYKPNNKKIIIQNVTCYWRILFLLDIEATKQQNCFSNIWLLCIGYQTMSNCILYIVYIFETFVFELFHSSACILQN